MSQSPYFDVLFRQLAAEDATTTSAFGTHVHWGYWPTGTNSPALDDGAEFGKAAERLCAEVLLEAAIGPSSSVLDVGCGFGGAIAMLNQRYAPIELTGVNIDPRQLDRARSLVSPRAGNTVAWHMGDACDLPLPNGRHYDAILAIECIFHFSSRAAFFRQASSRLRGSGRLVISDFVPSDALANFLRRNEGSLPGKDALRASYGTVDFTTMADYNDLAREAGLRLVVDRDVTRQTLPTYDFLLSHLKSWHDRPLAESFQQATKWLAAASRRGMLTYRILAFESVG